MIEYIEGDIFESPAKVIVNTVNTVGVMGKGLALSFKERYPRMFESYRNVCEKNMFRIGQLMLFYEMDHWILLFPTKENWRYPSKLEYIEKGLMKFRNTYNEKKITSIAFPRLGCGNGELNWKDVKKLMELYLKDLPIDIYIYLGKNPDIVPEHKEPKKTLEWLKKNAKDMSFNGVIDDLQNQCTLFPYEFKNNNEIIEMSFENIEQNNIIANDMYINIKYLNKNYKLSKDELFEIWDYIRTERVFSVKNKKIEENLFYKILYNTGYLSKIKIYDNEIKEMVEGYQINSGLGRVNSLKEN